MEAYGIAIEVAPGVRRVLARNPGPFTGPGTGSFIVGRGAVALIDPGPDDPAHIDALLAATAGERVHAILCTHTHRDHSPAARALAERTGAAVVGCARLAAAADDPWGEAFDEAYAPDRVLEDGEAVDGDDWRMEAVATPGHASNHLCFALAGTGVLFSGDHVMGWSTSIVSPPDGDMGDYIASLRKLLARGDALLLPAHGEAVTDPAARIGELIRHRRAREARLVELLREGPASVGALVPRAYADTDPRLFPAAERSALAHLLDLERRGLARREGDRWRS